MSKKNKNIMPKIDFSKMKFESAPVDKVQDAEAFVEMILDAMGHSYAYVTDESRMSDFFDVEGKDNLKELERIKNVLGVDVSLGDYLFEIATRMKESNIYPKMKDKDDSV